MIINPKIDLSEEEIWCFVHVYISSQPTWFVLGAMSALGHMVSTLFSFTSRNEIKWKNLKWKKKTERKKRKNLKHWTKCVNIKIKQK